MPSINSLLTMAAAAGTASAAFQGFNYGSTFTDGSAKAQSDFENEFNTAAGLQGTDGAFTSARLYTMIQGGTPNEPISAIPAAIKTKTSLLFGLWASGNGFANEIAALKNTVDQYCDQLDGLVAGISVGSEDLYRISPTGLKNNENPGADPDVLVDYIKQTRNAIKDTCLESVPIGHVDTWTAYANGCLPLL
jgi:glucan endo-1,3-beta-D-glucosidase